MSSEPKHYCNVTFLAVGDRGPDGLPIERLLRCSRCQETYYCGREQQRSHWSTHRRVCRPASEDVDEAVWQREGTVGVLSAIRLAFPNRSLDTSNPNMMGRALRYALQRLERLLLRDDPEIDEPDMFFFKQVLNIFLGQAFANDQTIELLWAIPGMTTYVLNLELISDTMRKRKKACIPPSREELQATGFDPSFQLPSFFASLICRFLIGSLAKNRPSDDRSECRGTRLAAAAAGKMMQWYVDPFTRASIPSVPDAAREDFNTMDRPRDHLFPLTMDTLLIRLPADLSNDENCIPGMTVKDFFCIITTEPSWKHRIEEEAGKLKFCTYTLLRSISAKPMAWKAFSIEDRAAALHQVTTFSRSLRGYIEDANAMKNKLLEAIAGDCNPIGTTVSWDGVLWL